MRFLVATILFAGCATDRPEAQKPETQHLGPWTKWMQWRATGHHVRKSIKGGTALFHSGPFLEVWDLETKSRLGAVRSEAGYVGMETVDGIVHRVDAGSPAEHAGLRKGDRILQLERNPLPPMFSFIQMEHFAAGDGIRLLVEGVKGRREVEIRLEAIPETYGWLPDVTWLESDALVEWAPFTYRVDAKTGAVKWRAWGAPAAVGRARVAMLRTESLTERLSVAVHDLETGERLWEFKPERPFLQVGGWTSKGLCLSEFSAANSRLLVLAREDGEVVWERTLTDAVATADVHGDRALALLYDLHCSARPYEAKDDFERFTPMCEGPQICIRYELIDLADGRVLWEATTGGRKHFTGSHGEPFPEEFNPQYGGPGKLFGDRVAWFDLESDTLKVISAETGIELLSEHLAGALTYPWAPTPWPGLALRCEDEMRFLRFEDNRWFRIPLPDHRVARWIDGERVAVIAHDGAHIFRIDETRASMACAIDHGPRCHSWSGGGISHFPEFDASAGVLVKGRCFEKQTLVGLFSLSDGSRLEEIRIPLDDAADSIEVSPPYLILPAKDGFDLWRRP